jgi:hypothetical protein
MVDRVRRGTIEMWHSRKMVRLANDLVAATAMGDQNVAGVALMALEGYVIALARHYRGQTIEQHIDLLRRVLIEEPPAPNPQPPA